jgi:DegV family protein with EDD domain
MSQVAIVTDSTASIPPAMLQGLPVFVLPTPIICDEQVYMDGDDVHSEVFYSRLRTDRVLPTTSSPSPGMFYQLYKRLVEQGYDILSIHVPATLSGMLTSAAQARAMLPEARIALIDSGVISMEMGFQVLALGRAAEDEASFETCLALAGEVRQNTHLFAMIDTLGYLRRSGRVGTAAALLGSVLDIKPILTVREGVVEIVERVRTRKKAMARLLELAGEQMRGCGAIHLATGHTGAVKDAQALMTRACQRFQDHQIRQTLLVDISPAIGVHIGPGCVGVAFMAV